MDQNNNIQKAKPVPPFVRYCSAIIPTAFDDSLSYYEALCALNNFIQKNLVEVINNNATVTEEYIKLANDLKEYVENYFDNLDVQEEINNKLDDMAEDGTLQEIVGDYLNANAVWGFDSVADMKASTNLINGSFARTLGYYAKNDGGGAVYKIRTITNDDVVDEAFIVEMGDSDNQLVAELIISNNDVNIKQLGGRSQDTENNKYDIKPIIDKYITYINSKPQRIGLYIPSGIWYSSKVDLSETSFDIHGDWAYSTRDMNGTLITTMYNNQECLFNIGNNTYSYFTKNWNLENIQFSTFDYSYNNVTGKFEKSTGKTVSKCVLNMLYAIYGHTNNIMFIYVIGEAMRIASCWENRHEYLVFRFVSNPLGDVLSFKGDKTLGASASISSNEFSNIFFESTHGNLMGFYSQCAVINNHFGSINFEPNEFNYDSLFTYTSSETLPDSVNHLSVIKFEEANAFFSDNSIDEINLNAFPATYYTYNGNNYIYDTIITTTSGYNYLGLSINNLLNQGGNQPIVIMKNDPANNVVASNYLNVGYMNTSATSSFKFDLDKSFTQINYNGICGNVSTVKTKLNDNIIKFYKIATQDGYFPFTYTDETSPFDDKICCQFRKNGGEGVRTVTTGTTLYVLAKIENEADATFRYSNGTTSWNATLTGTGSFKWYEIDMSSHMNVGDPLVLKLLNSSSQPTIMLDSFFMK